VIANLWLIRRKEVNCSKHRTYHSLTFYEPPNLVPLPPQLHPWAPLAKGLNALGFMGCDKEAPNPLITAIGDSPIHFDCMIQKRNGEKKTRNLEN